MNRYKNAAPKEEVLFQIICPVCGLKDATSNKDTWTCPDCEDKKETKKRVVAGARAAIANPKTSPELKKALDTLATKIEQAPAQVKQEPEVKEIESNDLMAAFHKVTGTKPAEAAKVVQEFKVGGLQCKIVSTKRK